MKTTKSILKKIGAKAFAIAFAFTLSHSVNAQFTMDGTLNPNNRYGRTTLGGANEVHAIGIGNFTTLPNAALHINTNLLPATNPPTLIPPGEVLRTDASSANLVAWRMFSANVAANEKFV